MIDDQNVDGKYQCAEKHQGISFSQGKLLRHAEKIKTSHRQKHADPDLYARSSFQENSQDWHQHNVHGRDKTGLSDGGIVDSDLLEVAGDTENSSAEDSANEQSLRVILYFLLFRFSLAQEKNARQ